MFYLILFALILSYLSIVDINQSDNRRFFFRLLPVFLLLVFVYGFQYRVGHDYNSYTQFVTGERNISYFAGNFEYLFIGIIYIARYFDQPQLVFLISSTIQLGFLMLISYEVKRLGFNVVNFYFLHFAFGLLFFNQFSGLRQYIALYMLLYAIFLIFRGKFLIPIVIILISGLFHVSSLFFLPVVILHRVLAIRISNKVYLVAFLVLFILSFFDFQSMIRYVIELIPRYNTYANRIELGRTGILNTLTKIPKILLVLYSLIQINHIETIEKTKRKLNNISFISIIVLIISFNVSIFFRLYHYFDMFTYFPLMLLYEQQNKRVPKIVITYGLIIILLIKIILFPQGEYQYLSILFRS